MKNTNDTIDEKEVSNDQLHHSLVYRLWTKVCKHWVTIFITLAFGLSVLSSWWSYQASQAARGAVQQQCESRINGLQNNRNGWYKLFETFPALKDREDMKPFIEYLDNSVRVHCENGVIVRDS